MQPASKLNDKIISYGNTLTLHNCGEMNFTASAEEVTPKATVSIIGSRKINNAMTVFAYIYTPEGTSIESRGIRFISGTSYDKLGGDIAWNEMNRGNCKVQELSFTKSGSHMMVTLYGITTEKTVRRAAQAFATVKTANGTEEIFSNAVCETFKTTKLNPIVKYDKQKAKPLILCSATGTDTITTRITIQQERLFALKSPQILMIGKMPKTLLHSLTPMFIEIGMHRKYSSLTVIGTFMRHLLLKRALLITECAF